MTSSAGYVLRLTSARHQVMLDTLDSDAASYWSRVGDERRFGEPVPDFSHSRNVPLLCFLISSTGALTHIGLGRRGQTAGTDLRKLNVTRIQALSSPLHSDVLTNAVSKRFAKRLSEMLTVGGILPPKTFEALVAVVSSLSPDTAELLHQFSQSRKERIAGLSEESKDALAEQKEGVATALAIAGISRTELQGWDFAPGTEPESFLDGLPQVRLREDPMIAADLVSFPGHDLVKTTVFSSVVFQNDDTRLTVILANRLPLEELLGTDLIYYNETFKCFVMVQYKAMEGTVGSDAVFRLPSAQLDAEITRMEKVLAELTKCPSNDEVGGYRLTENPFFLKLCPRLQFNPDDQAMTKGMYLPLDYWKFLVNHPGIVGSKGGKAISYKNAGRYFDNSEFTRLVAKAWIGSTTAQSAVLAAAIRETIEAGRAVTIAVEERFASGTALHDVDADAEKDALSA